MSGRLSAFFLIGFLTLCGNVLRAQVQGEITGEVADDSGAVMPGVTVTATNEGTNALRRVQTNAAGVYSFQSLLPGSYRVQAELDGFQTMLRTSVEVQVQQVVRIDFRMQVGAVSEVVEVTAEAPLLNTENTTLGTVIENKRIVDLPLNGRNFLQLVSLSPNVTFDFARAGQQNSIQGTQRSQQTISVAGQRAEFNRFTLDGLENTDPNFNSYVFLPSIDALQEFKVQTGVYPAEFGKATSQVNVSTKSGTNEFHGALFEFFRNDNLDARYYAFSGVQSLKEPFVRNQFGAVVGGPIVKNRLFFMANYEGLRDRRGLRQVGNVPSVAMRGGDFAEISNAIHDPASRALVNGTVVADPFPGNRIPTSRLNQKSVALLKYYSAPNQTSDLGLVRNYQALEVEEEDDNQVNTRVDFAENSNSTWFGRWSIGSESGIAPGTFPVQGSKGETDVQQAMLSNTRVLTPTMVNELRFGYNRFINSRLQRNAYDNDVITEIGGIPGVAPPEPLLYGIPSIGITGYSGFGDPGTAPNLSRNHTFQVVENMSIIAGRHSFRFGAEIRRERFNQIGNQFPRGSFGFSGDATENPGGAGNTGDGFADFMLGYMRTSSGSLGLAVAQLRATRQYYYIDDSWKIRPNLTLNLGLRYEFSPPYKHKHDGIINTHLLSVFDPNLRPTVVRAGSGDFYEGMPFRYADDVQIARDGRLGEALVISDKNDFAPRLGLAYSPTPNWTIRAGGGVFYTQDIGNARYDMSRNLAARRGETTNSDFPHLTLDAPFTEQGTLVVPFPLVLSNNTQRRTPYVIQYILNIQRQLTPSSVFEVGYIGNQGHKLERFRPYNFPVPGPGNVQDRRPFPELGIIQMTDGVVSSNYHALAAKLQQRFSSGLTAMVSYTYSKAIDNGSAIRTHGGDEDFPEDTYNLRHSRGVSNFHQHHRYVTSLLWQPPFGSGKRWLNSGIGRYILGDWEIGSILTLRTGLPYTMRNGRDDANIGWNSQHPNRTSEPLEPAGGRDPDEYFNKAAFERIAPYTYGNVGRNTMIGPEAISWDFSTTKRILLPMEGHQLQFRFEAFNFPNRPNFSTPNSNLNSGSYARIGSTITTMRELQFSLKYIF